METDGLLSSSSFGYEAEFIDDQRPVPEVVKQAQTTAFPPPCVPTAMKLS